MIDVEAAVGMILEAESLTDGLNDEDADWLLNWGAERARQLIKGMTDQEAAGERVQRIMGVMRAAVAISTERVEHPAADQGAALQTLLTRYAAAFDRTYAPDAVSITDALSVLKGLSGVPLLEKLTQIAEKATAARPAAKSQPMPPENSAKPDHHNH